MSTTSLQPRAELIASAGFGDGENSYAHSMAWFNDRLYVGTTRNNLCMVRTNPRRDTMRPWPVRAPEDLYELDMRAQIWRHDPLDGTWSRVHLAPLVLGTEGRLVPREVGFRNMVAFQGRSDDAPALYACSMAWSEAPGGSRFIRSQDGETFELLDNADAEGKATSFRALQEFRGRLFTSPAGEGTSFYRASSPVVLVNDDPARGDWRPASEPGFGDPSNTAIVDFASFDDHLYAGTLNPSRGLQVWKTRAEGEPPFSWVKVIDAGAGRGNLNEGVLTLCPFGDALYVGTHISMGGHDRRNGVGPAAAELLRVYPDDTWELAVGEPRPGSQAEASCPPAGFGNPFNTYVWSMAAHSGALYVGTLDVTVFLRYVDWTQRRPDSRRAMSSQGDVAAMVDNLAGCELWCTFDGTRWEPVTRTGFGNPYNYGARTLQATEHGLFVGTANPFGPQVAVGNPGGGWAYVDNPEGGLEVWRLRAAPRVPGSRQEAPPRDRVDLGESLSTYSQLVDRFYESSGFSHLGLWRTDTTTQREACENLMEELLGFLPHTVGTILDAAPGEGATTRHLTRYFSPDAVTGISSSPQKLERCRYNAPGCRFLLMDATDLEFPDGSFDHVICAEAAFRFDTRADFLREALRVLEPGGRLVLSDVLITPLGHAGAPRWLAANRVPSPAAYAELLGRAGFTEVRVRDATLECWRRHLRHRVARAVEEFLDGNIDPRMLDTLKSRLLAQLAMVSYYVLASGCKPGQRTP